MRPQGMKLFLTPLVIAILLTSATLAQSSKDPEPVNDIGKCLIKTDSVILKNVRVADLINWVEHPPFLVNCENNRGYSLKSYEFTFLTLKPFMNQSYGVGDDKMIPILARKAMDKLKPGDTVILKDVIMTDKDGHEHSLPTLSLKISE